MCSKVFLYRLKVTREAARAMVFDYLREINRLVESPSWYNSVTHNCTTTSRYHAEQLAAGYLWSWILILNGYVDEPDYDRAR